MKVYALWYGWYGSADVIAIYAVEARAEAAIAALPVVIEDLATLAKDFNPDDPLERDMRFSVSVGPHRLGSFATREEAEREAAGFDRSEVFEVAEYVVIP